MRTPELEWKYIEYATQLRMLKAGTYGKSIFLWLVRIYLVVMLKRRRRRIVDDFKDSKLTLEQYNGFTKLIDNSLK